MTPTTRTIARTVMLAAVAVALSPYSLPIGAAKVFPFQHMLNVIAAVTVGPWWAMVAAAVASTLRNAMGTGTLLAFPGSMIGAVLAGLTFRATRNVFATAGAEVVGTGLLGGLVGAAIVAPMFMDRPMALGALLVPFIGSAAAGAVLGVLMVRILDRAGVIRLTDD